MTLYECRGEEHILEIARQMNGTTCNPNDKLHMHCNTIAATWNIGSEGFNYPPEAGYPLEPFTGPRYFMLETHYSNPQLDAFVTDNSGMRLLYTDRLRNHDAGVLSVGIDPNWRHIIPPGQPEVISEGHCITRCTESSVPLNGVNIFSVIMHTHQLGKKVRLRQIRQGREMPPIASDMSYDPSYQEYRSLQRPAKLYPVSFITEFWRYCDRNKFWKTYKLGEIWIFIFFLLLKNAAKNVELFKIKIYQCFMHIRIIN